MFKQLELSRKAITARVVVMLGAGGIIASLAAIWYTAHFERGQGELDQEIVRELHIRNTGWETLGGTAIAMAVIAVLIIAIALFSGTTVTRLFLFATILCAVLVAGLDIWRLITPPFEFQDPALESVGRGPGQYLSLVACLIVVGGALWGMRSTPELILKNCPDCAGQVPEPARKCMHCGWRFADPEEVSDGALQRSEPRLSESGSPSSG